MLNSTSGVDIPTLHINSLTEAEEFIQSYGYDPDIPSDLHEIEEIRRESIRFIGDMLISDVPELVFPDRLAGERDVRKLLLWASNSGDPTLRAWTCALLRVMHTFAHCGSYFNDKYGEQIRNQVKERFRPHLYQTDAGLQLGTGPEAVPLVEFEMRGGKSRRSLALKLLYKQENVSSGVFDWVGMRFVTADRFDALRVLRYLRENSVVSFMQVRPGRSRNTLIDEKVVQECIDKLTDRVRSGKLPDYRAQAVLRQMIAELPYPSPPQRSYNPLSSVAYHSIQFTCMHRVRAREPMRRANGRLNNLRNVLESGVEFVQSFTSQHAAVDESSPDDAVFLFPYEVQILDRASYEKTQSGLASHDVYKDRQRRVVQRRVLGDLLSFVDDEGASAVSLPGSR